MKQSYQNKKWLQEEINRLGTLAAVAKEYGWGKNMIARWMQRDATLCLERKKQIYKEKGFYNESFPRVIYG